MIRCSRLGCRGVVEEAVASPALLAQAVLAASFRKPLLGPQDAIPLRVALIRASFPESPVADREAISASYLQPEPLCSAHMPRVPSCP